MRAILPPPWLRSSPLFAGGADLARAHGNAKAAEFVLAYADWLNSHIEEWCVTNHGELVPGKPRHYIRITPADPLAPDPHPDPDNLMITLANGGGTHPARNIVGGDFLHLVRLGLRPADDRFGARLSDGA